MEYDDIVRPCGCKHFIYKENEDGILTYYPLPPCGCCTEEDKQNKDNGR